MAGNVAMLGATAAVLFAAACVTGCDKKSSKPPAPKTTMPAPRVEATLDLPNSGGHVHVVRVHSDAIESTPCLVAVSPTGAIAVSCGQRGIDLPPDSQGP